VPKHHASKRCLSSNWHTVRYTLIFAILPGECPCNLRSALQHNICVKITVFCFVAPCSLVEVYQGFRVTGWTIFFWTISCISFLHVLISNTLPDIKHAYEDINQDMIFLNPKFCVCRILIFQESWSNCVKFPLIKLSLLYIKL
jgi:hypothetical protein